jgi:hypothetical protein
MTRRFAALALIAALIAACSGNSPQTTAPAGGGGATATPGTEATPAPGGGGGGGQTPAPNAGGNEAKARALVPDGSTETGHAASGNVFLIYLTNPKSVKELEAFWDAKIPQAGLTKSSKFEANGAVTYAFSNPDGGIVASPDSSGTGSTIVITVGNAT